MQADRNYFCRGSFPTPPRSCAVYPQRGVAAEVAFPHARVLAEGTTEVSRIYHLDRGYADLESKLGKCGARMERVGE